MQRRSSVHAKNKAKNIACQEEIYCRQKGLYDMWRPLSPTKVLCTPPKVREREKGCKGQTGVRKRVVQQDAGWCLILLLFQVRIFTSFPEVPSKLRTAVGTSPEHGDHHTAPELERGNLIRISRYEVLLAVVDHNLKPLPSPRQPGRPNCPPEYFHSHSHPNRVSSQQWQAC